MLGVILAAGIGKRLRPITDKIPKCLVNVGEKTIIEHLLDSFSLAGMKEIVIVVGFNQEAVREKVGISYNGMNIIYRVNSKYDCTNNLYSLWNARDMLTEGFIQCHGDLIVHPDIFKKVVESENLNAVIVDKDIKNFNSDANRVRLYNGIVLEINKFMPFEESGGVALGIYKFSKEAAKRYVQYLDENKEDSKNGFELCLRPTMRDIDFGVIDTTGLPYAEIDDLNDLENARLRISRF